MKNLFLGLVILVAAGIIGAAIWFSNPKLPPPQPEVIFTPTFGWVKDDNVIKENLNPTKTLHFRNTPAGKAILDTDKDVYLWRTTRVAAGHGATEDWYSSVNQQNVGCCVGCGWKGAVDCLLAIQAVTTKREDWTPVSVEGIYALSRVEIGKKQIRGDGSNGSWAAKAVNLYGVLAMKKYDSIDLSTFSPSRARQLGNSGLSSSLENIAKQHPVRGTALVQSWADVKKSIQQGYPVAVCSDLGFAMTRDSTGRIRQQGTWGHCQCIIGVRNGNNEGGFILNSWGRDAYSGPKWPEDMPLEGAWVDASVIDRMVKEGDSFALSDAVGFPARVLPFDWFILNTPNNFKLLKLNNFEVARRW